MILIQFSFSIKRLLKYRKANSTLIYGQFKDLAPADEQVFAYQRWDEEQTFYVVLNFSKSSFPLTEYLGDPKDWRLEISNYTDTSSNVLRPWEVSNLFIIKIKKHKQKQKAVIGTTSN